MKVAIEKTVYIKTYGCGANIYDSHKLAQLLAPHGFKEVAQPDNADLVILNTCNIREKAAEKVYSELGRIRKYKEKKKAAGESMIITVAGCVGQAEGEEMFNRAPFLDIVVGPQSYQNLPALLEEVKRKNKWQTHLDFDIKHKFDEINNSPLLAQGVCAVLSIQEGCDKFCHFCIVPYTRGKEYSRSVSEIYREALKLVELGSKEISLLGQNVSAYNGIGPEGDIWSLGKLIKLLAKIKGLERIRYLTSHPSDMTDNDLFDAHAHEPKLMPFVHLPIQSGSNRILKAMNRKHTREFYLGIIDKFRKARSDIAFSSDFIVGYPGEEDSDFEQTLKIVQEVEYAQCYSFKYSIRHGTPASILENQVHEEVKSARILQLQELIKEYQKKFNIQFLNKKLKVLLEKPGKHINQVMGKSEHLQSVVVNEPKAEGIYEVQINSIEPNCLIGQVIT